MNKIIIAAGVVLLIGAGATMIFVNLEKPTIDDVSFSSASSPPVPVPTPVPIRNYPPPPPPPPPLPLPLPPLPPPTPPPIPAIISPEITKVVISKPLPKREAQEFIVKIYSNTHVGPADLIVRIGDTVTFINEDNNLHWPGADPHPTHSSLATFDALGGISQGQSYSHTFRRVGDFGYHEHLLDNPPTLGTITVLP